MLSLKGMTSFDAIKDSFERLDGLRNSLKEKILVPRKLFSKSGCNFWHLEIRCFDETTQLSHCNHVCGFWPLEASFEVEKILLNIK